MKRFFIERIYFFPHSKFLSLKWWHRLSRVFFFSVVIFIAILSIFQLASLYGSATEYISVKSKIINVLFDEDKTVIDREKKDGEHIYKITSNDTGEVIYVKGDEKPNEELADAVFTEYYERDRYLEDIVTRSMLLVALLVTPFVFSALYRVVLYVSLAGKWNKN